MGWQIVWENMPGKQGETKLMSYASTNISEPVGINGVVSHGVEGHTVISRFNPKWKPMLIKQKGGHNVDSIRSDFGMSLAPSGRNGPANGFPTCIHKRFKPDKTPCIGQTPPGIELIIAVHNVLNVKPDFIICYCIPMFDNLLSSLFPGQHCGDWGHVLEKRLRGISFSTPVPFSPNPWPFGDVACRERKDKLFTEHLKPLLGLFMCRGQLRLQKGAVKVCNGKSAAQF
jgi:hypothetical protein